MDRRAFLAGLGVGCSGALGGCLGGRARDDDGDASGRTTAASTTATAAGTERNATTLAQNGLPATICEEDVSDDPGIYAIVDPAFGEDWSGLDVDAVYTGSEASGLAADATVVSIERDGVARAYPVDVLWHHEIVNDDVGDGPPVMVTYCPLCNSGMVAERLVDGTPTRFLVSGLLWQAPWVWEAAAQKEGRVFGTERTGGETVSVTHSGNLVMYDAATRSYWSQILATAICGPEAGTDLTIVPSTVSTWGEWRAAHPDGEVLLPPPASTTTDPDESP